MSLKKKILVIGLAALFASSAMPVAAALKVIEKQPEKAAVPPQQVIEEGQGTAAENERLLREVTQLRSELARVQAELVAAKRSSGASGPELKNISQTLDQIELRIQEVGSALVRVHFGFGSTKFIPPSQLASALITAGQKAKRIDISGHADSAGSVEGNLAVGFARAQAAKKYLTDRGVSPSKVFAISRGADDPIATNETAGGRAQNRRVEINFTR